MRERVAAIAAAAVAGVALGASATAPAASGPHLSAKPNPVDFGQTLTIKGRGWPVIEFCKRRVRLSLQSAQNSFVIGRPTIADNGRFVRRWVPRKSHVSAGRWKLVARLRCESGEDGSTNFVRRSVSVRIR